MSRSPARCPWMAFLPVRNHRIDGTVRPPMGFWVAVTIGLVLIAWSALLLPFVGMEAAPAVVTEPDDVQGRMR